MPQATERIINVFKRNGIVIVNNKDELINAIQRVPENERQRDQALVQNRSPEKPREVLSNQRLTGDGL